jgi:hypothetical protein
MAEPGCCRALPQAVSRTQRGDRVPIQAASIGAGVFSRSTASTRKSPFFVLLDATSAVTLAYPYYPYWREGGFRMVNSPPV